MAQQSPAPKNIANYIHTGVVIAGYIATAISAIQQMPGIPAKYQTFLAVALGIVTAGIHAAGSIGPGTNS